MGKKEGIYTIVNYADVDLILTDDRYFRSEEEMADSIGTKPSAAKTYFGAMQMEWLKNTLLNSRATFKLIVSGNQAVNPSINMNACGIIPMNIMS